MSVPASPRPPRYPLWIHATDLAARLKALPVFRDISPESPESELATRFFKPESRNGGAPLSEQLRERFRRVEHHVGQFGVDTQARLKPLLDSLRASLDLTACKTCAHNSQHVCGGVNLALDDLQLESPGLCLELLHAMWRDVTGRYGAALDELARSGDATTRADLTCYLSLRVKAESAYDSPGRDWKAGGTTRFADARDRRVSEIGLALAVDELDWRSLCVVYWVFVHEFLCHANQGRATALPRQPCRQDCLFFEGWMDEVAFRLMALDLDTGILLGPSTGFVAQHACELRQAASDFRCDRYGWHPGERRLRFSASWDQGKEAVGQVISFLERHDATPQVPGARIRALQVLFKLSFRLQALAPSPSQAREIMMLCLTGPWQASSREPAVAVRVKGLLTQPIDDLRFWINELRMALL